MKTGVMNRSCEDRIALRLMDLHPSCMGLAVAILGHIIPVLAVIVTIVNVLIVVVFMNPHIRSHTTFILTLIACVDIMDMICPTIVFVYHYMFGNYNELLTCREIEWIYILGEICVDIFNMLSLWLTVLLAYIRCRCIKSPFIARHVHSFKRIVVYIICILILVLSLHVPSFFIFDFHAVETVDSNSNVSKVICGILEPDGIFLKSCSRRKVHVLLETLLDSIIPCVILVYFNFVMLIYLRNAKHSRSSLRQSDSADTDYQQERICNTHEDNSRRSFLRDTLYKERNKRNDDSKKEIININCFKCQKSHTKGMYSRSTSSDSTLDKLDRESRRTSWLIFLVSTVIVVHEIPFAVAKAYAVATHRDDPLPLSITGCFSVILRLWQFITYPAIFLIYACMSSAFRSELWKSLTYLCNYHKPKQSNKTKSFLSPCSVRKARHDTDTDHYQDYDLINVHASDSGSNIEFDIGIKTSEV